MSHIVIYQSNDGQSVYHRTEGLEEAARHVEWLHNSGRGNDARIFRMQEVPIEVKTYYRVEVAAVDEGDHTPASSVPAQAPAGPAGTAPAPAPFAPPAPAAPAPHTRPETAGAGLNGGRFGLFGEG